MNKITKQQLFDVKCDIYNLLKVIKQNEKIFHKTIQNKKVDNIDKDLNNNGEKINNLFNNKIRHFDN